MVSVALGLSAPSLHCSVHSHLFQWRQCFMCYPHCYVVEWERGDLGGLQTFPHRQERDGLRWGHSRCCQRAAWEELRETAHRLGAFLGICPGRAVLVRIVTGSGTPKCSGGKASRWVGTGKTFRPLPPQLFFLTAMGFKPRNRHADEASSWFMLLSQSCVSW